MKSKSIIITGCLLGILVLFALVSNLIAPLSVEHGENVAFAKYMAQGWMPYRDFAMTEGPVGIGILAVLYRIVGIGASSYWATACLVFVHLLNGWLLWKLMRRVSVEKVAAFVGLMFYLLLVYSSDGMMLYMVPFAVSFLLGACLLILQRTKRGLVGAGICYALALGCQAQAIFLLPILTALVLWKGKQNRFHLEKGLLFVGISLLLTAAGYVGMTLLSENTEWGKALFPMQELDPYQTVKEQWIDKAVYMVIQGGRCSLFFLLALPWVWKKLNIHGKRFALLAIGAFICYLGLFYFKVEVAQGMLVYPFVTIALSHILQSISNRFGAIAMAIAVLLIPGALTLREFRKLEMGQVKAEQQEELVALKEIVTQSGTAIVKFGECVEYELGPQIFAELPQLLPLKNDTDWEKADYIILTESGFSEVSSSEESEAFIECISERKSYGTGNYLIYVR